MSDDFYWNYRILKRKTKTGKPYYGLVEVYYENDKPVSWHIDDIIACDEDEGSEGIVRTLMLMLKDAQRHEVLDEEVLIANLPEKESIFANKDAVEKFFGEQADEA